ncbi:uncharacterized protein LOC129582992 [Paramacrobiotus metropolitanus]|uniref:uncharacterized protein LOC129582992 n=1 Tax=Paramacrobiotus metropolitanus TaxID=2943436 RepID=UPI002445FC8C|nr:uncharacterized protein LOC129582992 [Paramacrobiotus metropolitanus]
MEEYRLSAVCITATCLVKCISPGTRWVVVQDAGGPEGDIVDYCLEDYILLIKDICQQLGPRTNIIGRPLFALRITEGYLSLQTTNIERDLCDLLEKDISVDVTELSSWITSVAPGQQGDSALARQIKQILRNCQRNDQDRQWTLPDLGRCGLGTLSKLAILLLDRAMRAHQRNGTST